MVSVGINSLSVRIADRSVLFQGLVVLLGGPYTVRVPTYLIDCCDLLIVQTGITADQI